MLQLAVQLTIGEAGALLELIDDQLFRMKFIDSKIPGHWRDGSRVTLSAAAVIRLQAAYKKALVKFAKSGT